MREGLQKVVSEDETIVAIATPFGHSGIGIVRVSGNECRNIALRFFTSRKPDLNFGHRTALLGSWSDDQGKIDEVILTFFQAPNSYTGEDVLEISAHGNPLSLRRIVGTVCSAGARFAAPGEFTLRGVQRGKMDLTQAEAV